jgi:hypothetical protein
LVAARGTFPPRRPFLDKKKKIPEAREPLNRCGNTPEEKSAHKEKIKVKIEASR